MDISFKNKKLERQLTTPRELFKKYGQLAPRVKQRIKELDDAVNLETMKKIPYANCHELKGNFKGKLALDLSKNYRLLFEPNHDPMPIKKDGGLDWEK